MWGGMSSIVLDEVLVFLVSLCPWAVTSTRASHFCFILFCFLHPLGETGGLEGPGVRYFPSPRQFG